MECALSRDAGDDRRRRRALARVLSRRRRAFARARRRLGALLAAASLVVGTLAAQVVPSGARRLDRGRFTIVHYDPDAQLAASMLEAAVTRDTFPGLPRGTARVLIMIAPDAATFRTWAGRSSLPWTAALAFVEQRRIVMQGRSAPASAGDPLQVLRHELAHIALHDHLGDGATRWFDEGYASYAAGESRMEGLLSANAALVFRGMPSLAALDTMLLSPRGTDARAGYALALRAVTDLAAIDRDLGLAPLLTAWRERGSFDLALRRASTITAADFERQWQQRARWSLAFLAVAADSALGVALLLLLFVPLHLRRRRAHRARLDAMRLREAILERSNQSAALEALLRAIPPAPDA